MHSRIRILALEAYYGGSHRAFLDTWIAHSRHDWTLLTLPARHWKWRMRGSAMWFAEQIAAETVGRFDLILTSDMTSVADLKALLDPKHTHVPIVCYFHENQLTYPLSPHDVIDFQYGLTNITSILASSQAWFNSHTHLKGFTNAAVQLIRKMRGHRPDLVSRFEQKCRVHYPAIESPPNLRNVAPGRSGPPRILWNHRWEYDKNPGPFLLALVELMETGVEYELVFLGERFREAPQEFADFIPKLVDRVVLDGFLKDRKAYWKALESCDIVVSTAIQENFGLSILEAVLAGCHPLVPNRLSYREILPAWAHGSCLYETESTLSRKLKDLTSGLPDAHDVTGQLRAYVADAYAASAHCGRLDNALVEVSCAIPQH